MDYKKDYDKNKEEKRKRMKEGIWDKMARLYLYFLRIEQGVRKNWSFRQIKRIYKTL